MADKSIGALPRADDLYSDSLLVVEQLGEARSVTGDVISRFAKDGVQQYVDDAKSIAEEAKKSADDAVLAAERIENITEQAEDAAGRAFAGGDKAEASAEYAAKAASRAEEAAKQAWEAAATASGGGIGYKCWFVLDMGDGGSATPLSDGHIEYSTTDPDAIIYHPDTGHYIINVGNSVDLPENKHIIILNVTVVDVRRHDDVIVGDMSIHDYGIGSSDPAYVDLKLSEDIYVMSIRVTYVVV